MAINIGQAAQGSGVPLFDASRQMQMEQNGQFLTTNVGAQRDLSAQMAIAKREEQFNQGLVQTGLALAERVTGVMAQVRLENEMIRQQGVTEGVNHTEVAEGLRASLDENGNWAIDPGAIDFSEMTAADVQAIAANFAAEYQPAVFAAAREQITEAAQGRVGVIARGQVGNQLQRMFAKAEADTMLRSVQDSVQFLRANYTQLVETARANGNLAEANRLAEQAAGQGLIGTRELQAMVEANAQLAPLSLGKNIAYELLTQSGERRSAEFLSALESGDAEAISEFVSSETDAAMLADMSPAQVSAVSNSYEQMASDFFRRRDRVWTEEVRNVAAETESLISDGVLSWGYYDQVESTLANSGNTSDSAIRHLAYIRGHLLEMQDGATAGSRANAERAAYAALNQLAQDVSISPTTFDDRALAILNNATMEIETQNGTEVVPVFSGDISGILDNYRSSRQRMEEFRQTETYFSDLPAAMMDFVPDDNPEKEQIEVELNDLALTLWTSAGTDQQALAALRNGGMADQLTVALANRLGAERVTSEDFATAYHAVPGAVLERINLGDLNTQLRNLQDGIIDFSEADGIQVSPEALFHQDPQLFVQAGQSIGRALEYSFATPPVRIGTAANGVQPYAVYRPQDIGIDMSAAVFTGDQRSRYVFQENGEPRMAITYLPTENGRGQPTMALYDSTNDTFMPVNELPQSSRLRQILLDGGIRADVPPPQTQRSVMGVPIDTTPTTEDGAGASVMGVRIPGSR